jgi:hypothetical protein
MPTMTLNSPIGRMPLDLFDRVFLLLIDGSAQEARLAAWDALGLPGRSQAVRQQIRAGRAVFQGRMLGHGATAVDGRAPSAVVADELLALATA